MAGDHLFLFLMPVGTLLAILGFLAGRTATVSTGDILLLLGFGLHLAIVLWLIASTAETDTVFEDILKIVHTLNGGRGGRRGRP